jgi:hypothetical protein
MDGVVVVPWRGIVPQVTSQSHIMNQIPTIGKFPAAIILSMILQQSRTDSRGKSKGVLF